MKCPISYYNNEYAFLDTQRSIIYLDEQWRIIDGYSDYLISNYGRVVSCKFNKFLEMRLKHRKDGYVSVMLTMNGIRKDYNIHTLVAKHFVYNPDPEKYKLVNHEDGRRFNNYYRNLKWCNDAYNTHHAIQVLNSISGYNCILTDEEAREIYFLVHSSDMSMREIGEIYGVSISVVGDIKYGNTYKKATVGFEKPYYEYL